MQIDWCRLGISGSESSCNSNEQPPCGGLAVGLRFPVRFFLSLAEAGDLGPTVDKQHPRRDSYLRQNGLVAEDVALVHQVHSKMVIDWSVAIQSGRLEGDGIVGGKGQAAAVTVADCLPIAVYEHRSERWAVLHSGREGTGILAVALRFLGDIPEPRFSITMGPCISAANYPVDRHMAEAFARQWGSDCLHEGSKGLAVDLRQANLGILRDYERQFKGCIGQVCIYSDCTYDSPQLGSYRREKANFRRMLACLQA